MKDNATVRAGITLRRREKRSSCRWPVLVHCRKKFQRAMLIDFSRSGMGLEQTFGLARGDSLQIELINGDFVAARVAWSLHDKVGVEFFDAIDARDEMYLRWIELSKKSSTRLRDLLAISNDDLPRISSDERIV